MAVIHAETAEEHGTIPSCPMCHQMDQVRHMAEAYSRGLVQFRAPDGPTPKNQKFKVWPWAVVALIYLASHAALFVQMGGGSAFDSWPRPFQYLEVTVIAASVLVVVALSLRVFARLLRAQQETVWQYPAWDDGTDGWHRFYHCQRDGVVFDAQHNSVLSEEKQKHLRHLNIEGMKARHGRLTDESFEGVS